MILDPDICSIIKYTIYILLIVLTLGVTIWFFRIIYQIIPDKDKNTDILKWSPYIGLFIIMLFIAYDSFITVIISVIECLNSLTIFSSIGSKILILSISIFSVFGVIWSIRSDITNYYEKMENNCFKDKYEDLKLEFDNCEKKFTSEISKLAGEKRKLDEEIQIYFKQINSLSINLFDVKMLFLHHEFRQKIEDPLKLKAYINNTFYCKCKKEHRHLFHRNFKFTILYSAEKREGKPLMITIGYCAFYEISGEFVSFKVIDIERTEFNHDIMRRISNKENEIIKNVQIDLFIPEKFEIVPYDEAKEIYFNFLKIKEKWEGYK